MLTKKEEEYFERNKARQQEHNLKLNKNRDAYWKIRDGLLKEHEGKFIAFSHGSILCISDNLSKVNEFFDEDNDDSSKVIMMHIGHENEKPKYDGFMGCYPNDCDAFINKI